MNEVISLEGLEVTYLQEFKFKFLLFCLKISLRLYLALFYIFGVTEKALLSYTVSLFNQDKSRAQKYIESIRKSVALLDKRAQMLRLNQAHVEYFLSEANEFLEDISLINASQEQWDQFSNLVSRIAEKKEHLPTI